MATITVRQPRFLYSDSGFTQHAGGAEEPDIKETASQTYDKGAPVYKDSNGTIAVAIGAPVVQIAGIATKDATGTTGESARYRKLKPGDRLVMNLGGSSVTALSDVGKAYECDMESGKLVVDKAGGEWSDVTAADADNLHVFVEQLYTVANGYMDGDAVGDTNGRVVVRVPDQPALQG